MNVARARTAVLLILLAAGALACAPRLEPSIDRERVPEPEPVPSFGRTELHEHMWQMARDTEHISAIMRRSSTPLGPEEQDEVIALLSDMERIAERLAQSDARTVHPVLGKNIDLFRRDLQLARQHASHDPPNFFLAGSVSGACSYCHGTAYDKVNFSTLPRAGRETAR